VSLRVTRERIVLHAPTHVPEPDLMRWVEQKRTWIERARAEFARRDPPTYALADGEQLPFLGEVLTLRRGVCRSVRRAGDTLDVPDLPPARLMPLVQGWYRQQALAFFTSLAHAQAARLGRAPSAVKLTNARTRWGSCTATGELRFNWRVMTAPRHVAEYLCAHEVAHLRELNHSARFWRLVGQLMPEYAASRATLRTEGWRYALDLAPGTPER